MENFINIWMLFPAFPQKSFIETFFKQKKILYYFSSEQYKIGLIIILFQSWIEWNFTFKGKSRNFFVSQKFNNFY